VDRFYFAWMPEDYPEQFHTVREILEALSFECEEQEGCLVITAYNSKHGDEEIFLNALAPFLMGHMEWSGEENEQWKWEFTLGQPPKYFEGLVQWVASKPWIPREA
jgi:hypothetical protein